MGRSLCRGAWGGASANLSTLLYPPVPTAIPGYGLSPLAAMAELLDHCSWIGAGHWIGQLECAYNLGERLWARPVSPPRSERRAVAKYITGNTERYHRRDCTPVWHSALQF